MASAPVKLFKNTLVFANLKKKKETFCSTYESFFFDIDLHYKCNTHILKIQVIIDRTSSNNSIEKNKMFRLVATRYLP